MSLDQPIETKQKNKSALFTSLKEYLDASFLPLGFERSEGELGTLSNMSGANYIWQKDGRTVKVHCSRRSRARYIGEIRTYKYVGHSLSFTITTPVKTRLSVITGGGFSKAIMRFASNWNKHVQLNDLATLEHLETWVIDEPWARAYFADTAVANALNTLIPPDNTYRSARFGFSPNSGNFLAQLNIRDITPEKVADFFQAINTLMDAAEANPPMNEVEPSWMEQQSPKTVAAIWIGGFLAIPVLLLGIMCACMTTLLILGSATAGG